MQVVGGKSGKHMKNRFSRIFTSSLAMGAASARMEDMKLFRMDARSFEPGTRRASGDF